MELLERRHNRAAFECGAVTVTRYLNTVALQAQESMRSATRVAVEPARPDEIIGFFTLAAIKIVDVELPEDLQRTLKVKNVRSGAPAVLLGQLGVDRRLASGGLGTFLLKHAIRHAVSGAIEIGGVALVVDAIDASVAAWYQKRVPDFRPLTTDGMRLIVPMRTLAAALENTIG